MGGVAVAFAMEPTDTFGTPLVRTVDPDQMEPVRCTPYRPLVPIMKALLEQSVQDLYLTRATPQDARELEGAITWFYSTDENHPFSFHICCLVLGLDPEAVRWMLRKEGRL